MIVEGTVIALSSFTVLATLASLLKRDDWWIRVFDFPRVQIAAFTTVLFVALLLIFDKSEFWHYLLGASLAACAVHQLAKIHPYTWLARKQVIKNPQPAVNSTVSIMVANVLTPNRRAADLLEIIEANSPDILLTLETDDWWEEQLQTLEADYTHWVRHPLDNLYGMHLYSKLRLIDAEVKFLVEEGIPSIHTTVEMRNGHQVRLYCLHPAPPSPTKNETSTERDAELLMIAKHVQKSDQTVIVAGDLNDVSWSRTTELFQEIRGLLDPRIGRGFFSTFHAKYPFLRWPLDHIFHSNDFFLVSIDRLPYFGSDHFPISAVLTHQPVAELFQEKPEADKAGEQWAEEKIEKADADEDQLDN